MYAKIIVDIASSNVDKIFEYVADDTISVGDRVLVPFGPRKIEGYVVGLSNESEFDPKKLKPIFCKLDDMPVLTNEQLKLAEFMKKTFYIGFADCIRLFLPPELRSGKVKELFKTWIYITDENRAKEFLAGAKVNAKNQIGIIEYLLKNGKTSQVEINKLFSSATTKKLLNEGILTAEKEAFARAPYKDLGAGEDKKICLTPFQQKVVDTINGTPNHRYLLHGVTGSGKTEVYMHLIADCLKRGKTAICLEPEISLTPQLMMNFRQRFGDTVALLHSGLSAGERFDEWKRILRGDAKIIVGARSAIFAPAKNIGIIIMDEEHESSYVSESHPRFVTSTIAEFRQQYNECTLLLGSATPSMNSYHKAITGEYSLLSLPERVNGKKMPPINIVDMGLELALGNPGIFSNALISALEKCIKENNQAILFINRRGFASFVQCRECGFVAKCPDCDVPLALHKEDHQLKCHYCGSRFKVFTECPECHSTNLKMGAIGTEKVVEELHKLFPDVKVLRMDNDTTKTKDATVKILDSFRKKEAQILVGTQMVAKGHDFPAVTLVGILEPDLSLFQTSYLSTERTFALVTQVAGRAGRANFDGTVILQTYSPKHYVYRMASCYDYLAFYRKEINLREVTKFPPFSVIVRVLFTSLDEDLAKSALLEYYIEVEKLRASRPNDFIYINKMKSPINKIMKKFRCQILLRLRPSGADEIIKSLFSILDQKKQNSKVQVFIEVNAQDLR